MICKHCKNQISDGSIYCNWCGERQVKERKKKDEIKIPSPRQLKSGKWNIQLRAEGQSITEATAELCAVKAKAIRAEFLSRKTKSEDITLREAVGRYIESRSARIAPSTREGYEKIRNQYFQDIMDKKLSELNSAVLDSAIERECSRISRRGKPLSPKTIHNAWFLIASSINKYAPETDRDNISLPEEKKQVPIILKPEQIFPIIKGTDIELPCLLAMWLSLTMSEIRGLTKSKSIMNGQLIIVETVTHVKGKDIRKAGGKEEKRTRALNIPPYIQCLIDKAEGDIIVPLSGSYIYKKFASLLKKNHLPHISFHKLRHINASVMAMLNIPDAEANARGGWKSDYTRKRVYTHVFSDSRNAADAKIDEYFELIIGD